MDPIKQSNVICLVRGENTQCTINLHGCTITSWRYKNWEQLFVSRHTKYDNRKQIVGGIAIDFPKIGKWSFGPENGFARISLWEVIQQPTALKNGDIKAVFQLVDNPHTRSFWNFNFAITNTITLAEKTIESHVNITNTSPNLPIRFNLLFPIYVQVPDVEAICIKGLKNVEYFDETINDDEVYTDRRNVLKINDWMYRLYKDAPNDLEIEKVTLNNVLKIKKTNLNDVVVWNPWIEHGADVDDFRPEQYKQMIYVGLGNRMKECRLLSGESFEASFKLELWKEPAFALLLY